jgi:ADP-ribose pyrophosphatase
VYPTPGYTNEPLYIFVATGLTFGDTKWDDDEYLNIKKIPFDKALEMVKSGEIKDGKSVVAILRYALFKG